MEFQEFQAGMVRLSRTYGPQCYPQERVNLFWDELQKYPPGIFPDVVLELIANELKPPMLRQILALMDEEVKRRGRRPSIPEEKVPEYKRSPETMRLLNELMEKMGGKAQPTEDETKRHEILKEQVRTIDWKERQAGEKEQ